MTGSLTIKNGKYYAVLNVYEDGKRKKKWISTDLPVTGNKRRAEQFLREKLAEYERMDGIVHSDIRFSDYVRLWLDQITRKVDAVTMQGYQVLADGHILPYFDDNGLLLSKVDYKAIQRYIDTKHANGRLDGKGGLSARSLKLHKNIINQTLNMAVQNKLLPSNPCQFVVLPQVQRYESTFYNAKQLKALFKALENDPMLPLVKITAMYGLRRSELLGLQWDSIDFEGKTMTIRHTVAKVTEVVAKDKTKNASSRRTFPLIADALEIFRQAKKSSIDAAISGKIYAPFSSLRVGISHLWSISPCWSKNAIFTVVPPKSTPKPYCIVFPPGYILIYYTLTAEKKP